MTATGTSYLDPATLAAIGSLELRARMIVEGLMTGMHGSPQQGFSVEFAHHRQYAPGDDIRHLDWKVYGRCDKLYVKQYQKETNLDLMIVVDASGSMSYGSVKPLGSLTTPPALWRKYDHAASLAAALAYLSMRQQDRVGLIVFADTIRAATRVSAAQDQWRFVTQTLSQQNPHGDPKTTETADSGESGGQSSVPQPRQGTDLVRVFDQLLAKLTQRSLVVLISDLLDTAESLEHGLAKLRHARHDLIVLQTLDPAEITFPFRDPAEFIGLEQDGQMRVDPLALRQTYIEMLNNHLHRVQQITQRMGFDYLLLDTATNLGVPLRRFLTRRAVAARKRMQR